MTFFTNGQLSRIKKGERSLSKKKEKKLEGTSANTLNTLGINVVIFLRFCVQQTSISLFTNQKIRVIDLMEMLGTINKN